MSESDDIELTAPLEGLLNKPLDKMSVEELRQQVQYIQELRTSSQALQAAFRRSGQPKQQKLTAFDEF